jgi:hypothetical protein
MTTNSFIPLDLAQMVKNMWQIQTPLWDLKNLHIVEPLSREHLLWVGLQLG